MKELSKKSPYWLPKDRFLELKHFVRQYKDFIKAREELYLTYPVMELAIRRNCHLSATDPVYKTYLKVKVLTNYIDQIEMAFKLTLDKPDEFNYILIGILEDASYDAMAARFDMPVSRRQYYQDLRKFFYILDQIKMCEYSSLNETKDESREKVKKAKKIKRLYKLPKWCQESEEM